MRGKPKYKYGEKVIITFPESDELNAGEHVGTVEIIDKFGTFDDPSDVSYDILISDYRHPSEPEKLTQCLCKHWTEKTVKPYEEIDMAR